MTRQGGRLSTPLGGGLHHCERATTAQGNNPHYLYISAHPRTFQESCGRTASNGCLERAPSTNIQRPQQPVDHACPPRPTHRNLAHGEASHPQSTKTRQQIRKPDGQGLVACPPGLTADTTVFAIGRDVEMKVHMARRQGIASRGCLRSGICCTLALNALGGRLRFVWRCLKSTGASTLPKSLAGLKSDSQWRPNDRLNLT